MTVKKGTGLRQYIYRVNCSLGTVDYSVITTNSTTAYEELIAYFRHDEKFKIQAIDKLMTYRIKA